MAKKGGVLALLTGIAMGAVALFLSDESNRKKTVSVAKRVAKKAAVVKAEYKKNPKQFVAKTERKVAKIAKKTVVVAKAAKRAAVKTAKKR